MNLEVIHKILETVNITSIKKIVIERTEDGICVRGIDSDSSKVLVFSTMKGNIVEETVGVKQVGNLLNRLNLFDLSKTKAEAEVIEGKYIKSAVFKEGRKKGFVQFSNPEKIMAPTGFRNNTVLNRIVLNTQQVQTITGAVSALQPEHITFRGQGDEVHVEVKENGGVDNFVDVVGQNDSGDWVNNWDVQTFTRLLKSANKGNEDVTLVIDKSGMLHITVNDISFILLPMVTK